MTNDAPTWQGDELDLNGYLDRIGYAGDRTPTAATLRALHLAHGNTFPFENFDVFLDRPIGLDVESLQDKFVRRRRGGYCFEHTSLFAAALERLRFEVVALSGRVRVHSDQTLPETHAVLDVGTVETPETGVRLLADVGFGSTPGPIELRDGAETSYDGWDYRLEHRTGDWPGDLWVLSTRRPEGWTELHGFTRQPRHRIDYVVGSHYVSTHPRSPFTSRPFAQRLVGDMHYSVDATTLTVRRSDGSVEERQLTPDESLDAIHELLGIGLDADERDRLLETLKAAG